MKLDLRKIIDSQGASQPFECELETDNLEFPSLREYIGKVVAKGKVYNAAGVVHLDATIEASMVCICDRCTKEYESFKETPVRAVLVEENPDDDPALFVVEGDEVDLEEVLSTCFILDMETKFLCNDDCKGLCSQCGKNLNEGPCNCKKEIDPRFAVLQQLLDK